MYLVHQNSMIPSKVVPGLEAEALVNGIIYHAHGTLAIIPFAVKHEAGAGCGKLVATHIPLPCPNSAKFGLYLTRLKLKTGTELGPLRVPVSPP